MRRWAELVGITDPETAERMFRPENDYMRGNTIGLLDLCCVFGDRSAPLRLPMTLDRTRGKALSCATNSHWGRTPVAGPQRRERDPVGAGIVPSLTFGKRSARRWAPE